MSVHVRGDASAVIETRLCSEETPVQLPRFRQLTESLEGAFSVIIWDQTQQVVVASRDKLGRNGLLYKVEDRNTLKFSHLPNSPGWTELPVTGLFIWSTRYEISEFPTCLEWESPINFYIPSASARPPALPSVMEAAVFRCLTRGDAAIPSTAGILFSGGLDCSILAGLAAKLGVARINLYNVSFAGETSPDRLTALVSYLDLIKIFPQTQFRLILKNVDTEPQADPASRVVIDALLPCASVMDFNIGIALYYAARRQGRVVTSAEQVYNLLGITALEDSLLIKAGVYEEVNTPKASKEQSRTPCAFCAYTAKPKCVRAACKFCCRRAMDDRVCLAHNRPVAQPNVEARITTKMPLEWSNEVDASETVVLCGNGADELFGGYSRYVTAERHKHLDGWRDELVTDLKRLWIRNLGRDDRCVLAAGCTSMEHPYLAEAVIDWVARCPSEELRMGYRLDKETFFHSKVHLRHIALELGLHHAARFKKRAIQFGSRSSRALPSGEDKSRRKTKGDEALHAICPTLHHQMIPPQRE